MNAFTVIKDDYKCAACFILIGQVHPSAACPTSDKKSLLLSLTESGFQILNSMSLASVEGLC